MPAEPTEEYRGALDALEGALLAAAATAEIARDLAPPGADSLVGGVEALLTDVRYLQGEAIPAPAPLCRRCGAAPGDYCRRASDGVRGPHCHG